MAIDVHYLSRSRLRKIISAKVCNSTSSWAPATNAIAKSNSGPTSAVPFRRLPKSLMPSPEALVGPVITSSSRKRFQQHRMPLRNLVRMASNLPALAEIERLSPRVIRILGGNPGKFTLQGTNTYLIGHGKARILLDTGEGNASYKPRLQSLLEAEKCTIDRIVLSHWHHDHVQGVPHVLELCPSASVHKLNPQFLGQGRGKWHAIEDGDRITVDSDEGKTTLRAVFSPGHTADHTCFLLEEESALFTADAVLGHGTAVFDDLSAYMETLVSLANLDFTGRGYPGHGAVIEDAKAKVREYIAHRRQREKQVLEAFGTDRDRKWGSMDIVKVVYKDYPETLHIPAEGGVKQVLEKLELDGKIAEDDEGGWRLKEVSSL